METLTSAVKIADHATKALNRINATATDIQKRYETDREALDTVHAVYEVSMQRDRGHIDVMVSAMKDVIQAVVSLVSTLSGSF